MDGFFGIGFLELILIAIVALIVLGPERLPGVMREVASFIRRLRQLSSEFTSQFSEEFRALDEINPRKLLSEMTDPLKPDPAAKPANPKAPAAAAPPAAGTPTAPAAPPPPPADTPKLTTPRRTQAPPIAPPAPPTNGAASAAPSAAEPNGAPAALDPVADAAPVEPLPTILPPALQPAPALPEPEAPALESSEAS